VDIELRAFSLAGVFSEHLKGVQLVLNCAGPFSVTARRMIDACAKPGIDYLDIMGEMRPSKKVLLAIASLLRMT